jgi:hypothetical protein
MRVWPEKDENTVKSKIYITNYFPYQNYDAAFIHTELSNEDAKRVIFNGAFPLDNLNKLCFEIRNKIDGSSKNDLLLLTGKGIIDGFVLWVWLMKHNAVKVLTYNAQQKKYLLLTLSVEDMAIEKNRGAGK